MFEGTQKAGDNFVYQNNSTFTVSLYGRHLEGLPLILNGETIYCVVEDLEFISVITILIN